MENTYYTPIKDIKVGANRLNIKAIILSIKEVTNSKMTYYLLQISDESGCIDCALFDSKAKYFKPSDIIRITKVYAKVHRNKLSLYKKGDGELFKIGDFSMKINLKNDMSEYVEDVCEIPNGNGHLYNTATSGVQDQAAGRSFNSSSGGECSTSLTKNHSNAIPSRMVQLKNENSYSEKKFKNIKTVMKNNMQQRQQQQQQPQQQQHLNNILYHQQQQRLKQEQQRIAMSQLSQLNEIKQSNLKPKPIQKKNPCRNLFKRSMTQYKEKKKFS